MKKIFGIVVLGLLFNVTGFADVEDVLKEIKKNKDVVQGFQKVKDSGDDEKRSNNWRVNNSKILDSDKNLRKHVV